VLSSSNCDGAGGDASLYMKVLANKLRADKSLLGTFIEQKDNI